MDLYAGTPYWLVKNSLWNYFNPLRDNIKTKVAVVGAGITGALVAHELLEAGIDCCLVDRRSPATGSSCASTALLQYEIDIPLCRMAEIMREQDAVTAYRSCLESIADLQVLFKEAAVDADFKNVPSVFYASNRKGLELIEKEYEIRRKHDLPVEFLDAARLHKVIGIDALGALRNTVSAQIDTYKAATGLMKRDMRERGLRIYSHTEVSEFKSRSGGYTLTTKNGKRIKCDYVVIASGFEAGEFLPRKLMNLTSTFAIISQPVDKRGLWTERSLIWETRQPYLYIRTDSSNRIIVGGGDMPINGGVLRRFMLPHKAGMLEKRFRELFPQIPFITEMKWAGTFSSTRDGLPIIGAFKAEPRKLFALGYGGNGITFSLISAQIIAKTAQGKKDPRARIFSPERESLHK